MKVNIFLVLSAVIFTLSCSKKQNEAKPFQAEGLGPVGTETISNIKSKRTNSTATEKKLKPITDMGQRAVAWLNLVNSNRDSTTRLNLADRTTKNPVPPEKPKLTSVTILFEKFATAKTEVPASMKPFLDGSLALTEVPPVSDADFIKAIRSLNTVYQGAIRWIGQEQHFTYYASNDIFDIRGYYFFQKTLDVENKLTNFSQNSTADQTNFKEWLASMCRNTSLPKSRCLNELNLSVKANTVFQYYQKYLPDGKLAYENFFTLNPVRQDLKWSKDQSTITQNFIDPNVAKVANWLKTNIEEEWKTKGFQLLINFVPQNSISPFIEFVKGVTPNVSGNNWEKITMDPDYSLDDYNTQWTIRHEFGHILGFPDCYLEFYNKDEQVMTYYTIEPDNLMCAWGGVLQPSHIDQLKQQYR